MGGFHLGHYRQRPALPLHEAVPYRVRRPAGRTEKHVYQTEEDDGFGLWAALAVYQETGSLADAGLAAWALGGPSIETHIDTREIPGNVTLSIGHLRRGRDANLSLRYREDGRWVQVGAIQHFADITLAAINAYRASAL